MRLFAQYLAQTPHIDPARVQLVGVTAYRLATATCEICAYSYCECARMMQHAFTITDIKEMESILRQACPPAFFHQKTLTGSIFDFLNHFLMIHRQDFLTIDIMRAHYYCDRMLQEHNMLVYKPSLIAATAVYLALTKADFPVGTWENKFQPICKYTVSDMGACAIDMCKHLSTTEVTLTGRPLDKVKDIYADEAYHSVSIEALPKHPGTADAVAVTRARLVV